MKKKEKKGIGCATIIILLPIPGAIIYGLVSGKSDFAHSFVYGCIISLVFLICTVISAIKERAENRKAVKAAERAAKNAPAAPVPKPVESMPQAAPRAVRPVSQTVHINAPDKKGEGRIVLPEAQKKLMSQQLRKMSMLCLCLFIAFSAASPAFADPFTEGTIDPSSLKSVDNPPDSADVAVVEDEVAQDYEQYNSILFAYSAEWNPPVLGPFAPEIIDEKEYTDADGNNVYHRTLRHHAPGKDTLCVMYNPFWVMAPGCDILQKYTEYQDDRVVSEKMSGPASDNGTERSLWENYVISQGSTGARIFTEITSREGDKVILELLIGEVPDAGEIGEGSSSSDAEGTGEEGYVSETVIQADASEDKGEMPGFVVPAASAAVLLGGGAIIGKGKKRKAAKKDRKADQKEPEEEKEDEEEEEDVSYEMRVYKEFGDTINVGDDAVLYARMVAVYPDGSEKTDPSLTSRINIYPKTYLSLTSKQMSGDYMGAVISAPMADTIPEEAVIVFDLEGIYKVEMNFKIGDCIFITDPATGAQEFYTEDRKTGEWVSSDGKTILNLSNLAEWILQRQNDRRWIDEQNEKLRTHDTAFDRMLHEGDAAFEAEQRKIEEETSKILYNLKHYGTLDTDEAHIREIIARDQRINAIESRQAARQAVVYNAALWAATVVKYGTDKAFDFIGKYGGAVGKTGKVIYVLASDQAGALTDAYVNDKDMLAASGKAATGSLYNIGKDYFGDSDYKGFYVIGGRAAEAMANAFIDGKSFGEAVKAADKAVTKANFEVLTEAVGQYLGDMADDSGSIGMIDNNIYNIYVGDSDIIETGFNDLTAKAFEVVDESIEAYKKSRKKKGK